MRVGRSRLAITIVLSFWALGFGGGSSFIAQAAWPAAPQVSHSRRRRETRRAGPHIASTPAQHTLWTAHLAADRHTVSLAYGGSSWISGLRVEVTAGDDRLSSTAPGVSLVPVAARQAGQLVFKVRTHVPYEIVLQPSGSAIEVALSGFPAGGETQAAIVANIDGGSEPLQARISDPGDDIQQMVSGRAVSTLNDCVYDRFRDQALRILARDDDFAPTAQGFQVSASDPLGGSPSCRFELVDHVYGRRLPFYAPLDKSKWPHAPVGWISWYCDFSHITEKDIVSNAQAAASYYKNFGLDYCLVDAGWQASGDGENGSAIGGNWDASNLKFPHGMKWLADQIHSQGLKAALWLAAFGNADPTFYDRHPSWFLHDASGNARLGTWFGTYVADFSNPDLKKYLYDVYRRHELEWDYDYFKLDGENATRDIWAANRRRAYDPTLDANTAFREALSLIRQAMNSKPGVFLSACGPAYPTEAMGIAQSARLGSDVVADGEPPSFHGVREALAGMRNGYYTHNIAWYADPDALVVRAPLTLDEARTWTSILGLSGQLLMLGDDMTALPADRRDILRKVIPVAEITPMDLYPSAVERPIWVLHIARPFGTWSVVGLFNWDTGPDEMPTSVQPEALNILGRDRQLLGTSADFGQGRVITSKVDQALAENHHLETLPSKPAGLELLPAPAFLAPPAPREIVLNFAKAGLDPGRGYLLFDFWKQKFLGKIQEEYSVDLAPHECQVISVRPDEGHPQLIGTDRHITMGGVEIADEHWEAAKKQLRIGALLVSNYPSTFTVYTAGQQLAAPHAEGATITALGRGENIIKITLVKPTNGEAELTLSF